MRILDVCMALTIDYFFQKCTSRNSRLEFRIQLGCSKKSSLKYVERLADQIADDGRRSFRHGSRIFLLFGIVWWWDAGLGWRKYRNVLACEYKEMHITMQKFVTKPSCLIRFGCAVARWRFILALTSDMFSARGRPTLILEVATWLFAMSDGWLMFGWMNTVLSTTDGILERKRWLHLLNDH